MNTSMENFYNVFQAGVVEGTFSQAVPLDEVEKRQKQKQKTTDSSRRDAIVPTPSLDLVPHNRITHVLYLHPSLCAMMKDKGQESEGKIMEEKEDLRASNKEAKSAFPTLRLRKSTTFNHYFNVDTSLARASLNMHQHVTKRCKYNTRCRNAVATRQCYTCKEYNPEFHGLYCDECFKDKHPWFRVEHKWCFVCDAPDPDQKWLDNIREVDKRNMLDSVGMLQNNIAFDRVSLKKGGNYEETRKQITLAQRALGSTTELLTNLRRSNDSEYVRTTKAAKVVQRIWRGRLYKKQFRDIVSSVVKKYWDESQRKYYYVDTRTGEVTWNKPKIYSLAHRRRKPLKQLEACRMIQRLWRQRSSFSIVQVLALARYRMMENSDGVPYYINLKTRKTQWTKPKILGSAEPEIYDEMKDNYKDDQEGKEETRLEKFEACALKLQRIFKGRKARIKFQKIIQLTYERIYDPLNRRYYYYNSKTGESSWNAPRFAKTKILSTTERIQLEHEMKREAREKQQKQRRKTPRKRAAEMTEKEAACMLQSALRAKLARRRIGELVRKIFVKCVDEKTGNVYYFNSLTGESSWYKPRLLGHDDLKFTPRTRSQLQRLHGHK
eukprot:g871.t1